MLLGLDISTSCVGFCILDQDGSIMGIDAIDLKKVKSVFEKAECVSAVFEKIKNEFDISYIFIEENLQAFRPGFSSAKTLVTLARFNGIVSYIAAKVFELTPDFVNVNAARKMVGLKILRQKKCGISTKDQVLNWVKKNHSDLLWPTKTLKSGPNKGVEVLKPSCYDMADALVIAFAGKIIMNI
jgi:Holliday junction resolvasome RuvABC endonuclease subunit